jgi:energy-coupling factor transporter ATPase
LRGVDLTIREGEHVAIIGANGSGKSTLLRHFNALLRPTAGDVWVAGWSTRDLDSLRHIRSTVGMVFQAPDTQIVASVVEEDVAFGPENLGLPRDELRQRVDWALAAVGLADMRDRASHLLSSGQKQRLAVASALAMRPRCLLFDEATSLLDPAGRAQVLATVARLHRQGMTLVMVTHDMGEAALAQRVIVLAEGRIALQGKPEEVFSEHQLLQDLCLAAPTPARLARALANRVKGFPIRVLTVDQLVEAIAARVDRPGSNDRAVRQVAT